ncbi:MAG: aldo/keto reductase [Alphaproteobacteria bacterium]|nr:aldo/keto reductase [Alphaproteobacteria bacterium]MDE2492899.1 aldo/keto reductase [Alphaproteobacteria bacterium]
MIEELKSASGISAVGLGGAGIGNLYRAISDEQATATVREALVRGFGLVDTAPYYGHGLSETRIGLGLKSWRGNRPMLSIKVGRVLEPARPGEPAGDFGFAEPLPFRPRFDYSRAGVRRSLEGSLRRLGVERADIALVHDIGRLTHGEEHNDVFRQFLTESLPELEAARNEGLIRYVGIGVNEWEVCVEALQHTTLDCILLAGRYTLLEQPAYQSGLLDLCAERGVCVIAAGIFNSGLLATRPATTSTYNYMPATPDVLERAQHLWQVCEDFGIAPQAAALQFPLMHPAVAAILVGARSPAEVADLAAWYDAVLPSELWLALKQYGFVVPGVPTSPSYSS